MMVEGGWLGEAGSTRVQPTKCSPKAEEKQQSKADLGGEWWCGVGQCEK